MDTKPIFFKSLTSPPPDLPPRRTVRSGCSFFSPGRGGSGKRRINR